MPKDLDDEEEVDSDGVSHITWHIRSVTDTTTDISKSRSLIHYCSRIDAVLSPFVAFAPAQYAAPSSSAFSSRAILVVCRSGKDLAPALLIAYMLGGAKKARRHVTFTEAHTALEQRAPFIQLSDASAYAVAQWNSPPKPVSQAALADLHYTMTFQIYTSNRTLMKNCGLTLFILICVTMLVMGSLYSCPWCPPPRPSEPAAAPVPPPPPEPWSPVTIPNPFDWHDEPSAPLVNVDLSKEPKVREYNSSRPVRPAGELHLSRGIAVAFVGKEMFDDLDLLFASMETNLLLPLKIKMMIFYEAFPYNARPELEEFAKEHGWVWKQDHITGHISYVTPNQVRVETEPLALNVPSYIAKDAALLNSPSFLTCDGQRHDFREALEAVAWGQWIMRSRRLDVFDYIFKLDVSVRFVSPVPFNPYPDMASSGCIIGHTGLSPKTSDCHTGTYDAIRAYAKSRNIRPHSSKRLWCKQEHQAFDNKFLILPMGWYRSEENLDFLNFLFEDRVTSRYFSAHWSDGPVYTAAVCLWHEVRTLKDQALCDYSDWNGKVFQVEKRPGFQ